MTDCTLTFRNAFYVCWGVRELMDNDFVYFPYLFISHIPGSIDLEGRRELQSCIKA